MYSVFREDVIHFGLYYFALLMLAVNFKIRFAERKHDRHFKKANYTEKISEQYLYLFLF